MNCLKILRTILHFIQVQRNVRFPSLGFPHNTYFIRCMSTQSMGYWLICALENSILPC